MTIKYELMFVIQTKYWCKKQKSTNKNDHIRMWMKNEFDFDIGDISRYIRLYSKILDIFKTNPCIQPHIIVQNRILPLKNFTF